MNPATYNLLESVVTATLYIADSTLTKDRADSLRQDLTGKLTSLKVVMQREEGEAIVQTMAQTVLAMANYLSGKPVQVGGPSVQKKHLLSAMKGLRERVKAQQVDATLHPTGRCTCAGEGECEWCQSHCLECGMALRDDECPNCSDKPDPMDEPCPYCGEAGMYCTCKGDSEDVVEKAPEVETDNEEVRALAAGLDPGKWRLVRDPAGDPVAALYFNGRSDSLALEQVEELEEAILEIVRRW